MAAILQTQINMHFLERKLWHFASNFVNICSRRTKLVRRRQAVTQYWLRSMTNTCVARLFRAGRSRTWPAIFLDQIKTRYTPYLLMYWVLGRSKDISGYDIDLIRLAYYRYVVLSKPWHLSTSLKRFREISWDIVGFQMNNVVCSAKTLDKTHSKSFITKETYSIPRNMAAGGVLYGI